jgi:hypothetical protein
MQKLIACLWSLHCARALNKQQARRRRMFTLIKRGSSLQRNKRHTNSRWFIVWLFIAGLLMGAGPQDQSGGVELAAAYRQVAFPGETITFTHTVRNIGTGAAAFNLSCSTANPGWVVSFTPTAVTLAANEADVVELIVSVPTSAVSGTRVEMTITASDGRPSGTVSVVDTVEVLPLPFGRGFVYLPVIMKNATPAPSGIPQLLKINNRNGNGEYVVRWTSSPGVANFVLQEATTPSFSGASVVYSGPNRSTVVSGKAPGAYYYRVRAAGSSAWSRTEVAVVVSSPGIFGLVTSQGSPAPGIPLTLRCFNGFFWYTADTTTTAGDGIYIFDSGPTLDAGEYCYVRYGPNTANPNYLYLWAASAIFDYAAGTATPGGNFDIADVVLGPPDSSAIQSFPLTFSWTPRSATPGDSYELEILSSDSIPWTSGELGYVGSHTLRSRPAPLSAGVVYGWDMVVYGDDGLGISFDTHLVSMDGDAQACLYINNLTGSTMTFQIYGMAAKSMPTSTNLYDCFPAGTYTYRATASCGSLTDTDYFPVGSSTLTFRCTVANLSVASTLGDDDLESSTSLRPEDESKFEMYLFSRGCGVQR